VVVDPIEAGIDVREIQSQEIVVLLHMNNEIVFAL
jgi:hypothetical protein